VLLNPLYLKISDANFGVPIAVPKALFWTLTELDLGKPSSGKGVFTLEAKLEWNCLGGEVLFRIDLVGWWSIVNN
jgi:hypothetical protein